MIPKHIVVKSRFDPTMYANDAVQFFYGDIEPYYIVEESTLTIPAVGRVFAQVIALDLVAVQPMEMPHMPVGQLHYVDYQYNGAQDPNEGDEIADAAPRDPAAHANETIERWAEAFEDRQWRAVAGIRGV
jgi:hypothetical protein